jgi:ADP-heptose:LPS heptosyltransferase
VAGVGRFARWREAERILVVRLDKLSDVLMTTPAIAAVRETVPGARITLLTSPCGAELAPQLPFVDEVIAFEAPWVRHGAPGEDGLAGTSTAAEWRLLQRLADECFDAAIIFTSCTQSALPAALLCRQAGIPLRLAHCRENPHLLLSDWLADPDVIGDSMRHEVERQLALVGSVGFATGDSRLRFALRAADRQQAGEALAQAGIAPGQSYFVVHPGAASSSRRYPPDRFGRAAASLNRITGVPAVFTGSAEEEGTVEAARDAMGVDSISLAGRLGLGALGALLEGADVLLTNNTGPAHMAAALGTPVVDLYALTHPQQTPWRVPARVISHSVDCRNCLTSVCPQQHHACLHRVDAGRVVGAALELLAERASAPAKIACTG